MFLSIMQFREKQAQFKFDCYRVFLSIRIMQKKPRPENQAELLTKYFLNFKPALLLPVCKRFCR